MRPPTSPAENPGHEPEQSRLLYALGALGPHPARRLALEFREIDENELRIWLLAGPLFDGRLAEPVAETAWAQLSRLPTNLPTDRPTNRDKTLFVLSHEALDRLGVPGAQKRAATFARLSSALTDMSDELSARIEGAADLAELGGLLLPLAPGFGTAALARFLRPLRGLLSVLDELPPEPAAAAAATHLGLLEDAGDAEMLPQILRRAESDLNLPAGSAVDLEACLEKLGRRACTRARTQCPLGGRGCPRDP